MDINFRYNLLKRNVSENSEIEHKFKKRDKREEYTISMNMLIQIGLVTK